MYYQNFYNDQTCNISFLISFVDDMIMYSLSLSLSHLSLSLSLSLLHVYIFISLKYIRRKSDFKYRRAT